MRILGIDPGIAIVGYGIIDVERGNYSVVDYGVITTPKEENTPTRLCMIEKSLIKLIEQYKPGEDSGSPDPGGSGRPLSPLSA